MCFAVTFRIAFVKSVKTVFILMPLQLGTSGPQSITASYSAVNSCQQLRATTAFLLQWLFRAVCPRQAQRPNPLRLLEKDGGPGESRTPDQR
jgi:hypothetical protein